MRGAYYEMPGAVDGEDGETPGAMSEADDNEMQVSVAAGDGAAATEDQSQTPLIFVKMPDDETVQMQALVGASPGQPQVPPTLQQVILGPVSQSDTQFTQQTPLNLRISNVMSNHWQKQRRTKPAVRQEPTTSALTFKPPHKPPLLGRLETEVAASTQQQRLEADPSTPAPPLKRSEESRADDDDSDDSALPLPPSSTEQDLTGAHATGEDQGVLLENDKVQEVKNAGKFRRWLRNGQRHVTNAAERIRGKKPEPVVEEVVDGDDGRKSKRKGDDDEDGEDGHAAPAELFVAGSEIQDPLPAQKLTWQDDRVQEINSAFQNYCMSMSQNFGQLTQSCVGLYTVEKNIETFAPAASADFMDFLEQVKVDRMASVVCSVLCIIFSFLAHIAQLAFVFMDAKHPQLRTAKQEEEQKIFNHVSGALHSMAGVFMSMAMTYSAEADLASTDRAVDSYQKVMDDESDPTKKAEAEKNLEFAERVQDDQRLQAEFGHDAFLLQALALVLNARKFNKDLAKKEKETKVRAQENEQEKARKRSAAIASDALDKEASRRMASEEEHGPTSKKGGLKQPTTFLADPNGAKSKTLGNSPGSGKGGPAQVKSDFRRPPGFGDKVKAAYNWAKEKDFLGNNSHILSTLGSTAQSASFAESYKTQYDSYYIYDPDGANTGFLHRSQEFLKDAMITARISTALPLAGMFTQFAFEAADKVKVHQRMLAARREEIARFGDMNSDEKIAFGNTYKAENQNTISAKMGQAMTKNIGEAFSSVGFSLYSVMQALASMPRLEDLYNAYDMIQSAQDNHLISAADAAAQKQAMEQYKKDLELMIAFGFASGAMGALSGLCKLAEAVVDFYLKKQQRAFEQELKKRSLAFRTEDKFFKGTKVPELEALVSETERILNEMDQERLKLVTGHVQTTLKGSLLPGGATQAASDNPLDIERQTSSLAKLGFRAWAGALYCGCLSFQSAQQAMEFKISADFYEGAASGSGSYADGYRERRDKLRTASSLSWAATVFGALGAFASLCSYIEDRGNVKRNKLVKAQIEKIKRAAYDLMDHQKKFAVECAKERVAKLKEIEDEIKETQQKFDEAVEKQKVSSEGDSEHPPSYEVATAKAASGNTMAFESTVNNVSQEEPTGDPSGDPTGPDDSNGDGLDIKPTDPKVEVDPPKLSQSRRTAGGKTEMEQRVDKSRAQALDIEARKAGVGYVEEALPLERGAILPKQTQTAVDMGLKGKLPSGTVLQETGAKLSDAVKQADTSNERDAAKLHYKEDIDLITDDVATSDQLEIVAEEEEESGEGQTDDKKSQALEVVDEIVEPGQKPESKTAISSDLTGPGEDPTNEARDLTLENRLNNLQAADKNNVAVEDGAMKTLAAQNMSGQSSYAANDTTTHARQVNVMNKVANDAKNKRDGEQQKKAAQAIQADVVKAGLVSDGVAQTSSVHPKAKDREKGDEKQRHAEEAAEAERREKEAKAAENKAVAAELKAKQAEAEAAESASLENEERSAAKQELAKSLMADVEAAKAHAQELRSLCDKEAELKSRKEGMENGKLDEKFTVKLAEMGTGIKEMTAKAGSFFNTNGGMSRAMGIGMGAAMLFGGIAGGLALDAQIETDQEMIDYYEKMKKDYGGDQAGSNWEPSEEHFKQKQRIEIVERDFKYATAAFGGAQAAYDIVGLIQWMGDPETAKLLAEKFAKFKQMVNRIGGKGAVSASAEVDGEDTVDASQSAADDAAKGESKGAKTAAEAPKVIEEAGDAAKDISKAAKWMKMLGHALAFLGAVVAVGSLIFDLAKGDMMHAMIDIIGILAMLPIPIFQEVMMALEILLMILDACGALKPVAEWFEKNKDKILQILHYLPGFAPIMWVVDAIKSAFGCNNEVSPEVKRHQDNQKVKEALVGLYLNKCNDIDADPTITDKAAAKAEAMKNLKLTPKDIAIHNMLAQNIQRDGYTFTYNPSDPTNPLATTGEDETPQPASSEPPKPGQAQPHSNSTLKTPGKCTWPDNAVNAYNTNLKAAAETAALAVNSDKNSQAYKDAYNKYIADQGGLMTTNDLTDRTALLPTSVDQKFADIVKNEGDTTKQQTQEKEYLAQIGVSSECTLDKVNVYVAWCNAHPNATGAERSKELQSEGFSPQDSAKLMNYYDVGVATTPNYGATDQTPTVASISGTAGGSTVTFDRAAAKSILQKSPLFTNHEDAMNQILDYMEKNPGNWAGLEDLINSLFPNDKEAAAALLAQLSANGATITYSTVTLASLANQLDSTKDAALQTELKGADFNDRTKWDQDKINALYAKVLLDNNISPAVKEQILAMIEQDAVKAGFDDPVTAAATAWANANLKTDQAKQIFEETISTINPASMSPGEYAEFYNSMASMITDPADKKAILDYLYSTASADQKAAIDAALHVPKTLDAIMSSTNDEGSQLLADVQEIKNMFATLGLDAYNAASMAAFKHLVDNILAHVSTLSAQDVYDAITAIYEMGPLTEYRKKALAALWQQAGNVDDPAMAQKMLAEFGPTDGKNGQIAGDNQAFWKDPANATSYTLLVLESMMNNNGGSNQALLKDLISKVKGLKSGDSKALYEIYKEIEESYDLSDSEKRNIERLLLNSGTEEQKDYYSKNRKSIKHNEYSPDGVAEPVSPPGQPTTGGANTFMARVGNGAAFKSAATLLDYRAATSSPGDRGDLSPEKFSQIRIGTLAFQRAFTTIPEGANYYNETLRIAGKMMSPEHHSMLSETFADIRSLLAERSQSPRIFDETPLTDSQQKLADDLISMLDADLQGVTEVPKKFMRDGRVMTPLRLPGKSEINCWGDLSRYLAENIKPGMFPKESGMRERWMAIMKGLISGEPSTNDYYLSELVKATCELNPATGSIVAQQVKLIQDLELAKPTPAVLFNDVALRLDLYNFRNLHIFY